MGSLYPSLLKLNGSPSLEFKMQGVHQGDPLSHFLFLIAAEGLNVVMHEAINYGVFKGISVRRNNVCISHLQFANDTIFFGEWNLHNLMSILKCFQAAPGLKVNTSKSKLFGFGVHDYIWDVPSDPYCSIILLVGKNMNKIDSWSQIIEKLKYKFSGWKIRCLSSGGRLTLIKLVLGSLAL